MIASCLISSCGKKSTAPANNNEFNATVKYVSGNSANVNVKGGPALMGCSFITGSYYVQGMNSPNGSVSINFPDTSRNCNLGPGTYHNISCLYRKEVASGQIDYDNSAKNGSITFTTLTSSRMEGYFNAVCYFTTQDSVIVNGTFKGDHLN
jgi:hypothetical protein